MVLLTMTPSIVDGLRQLDEHSKSEEIASLADPAVGQPITHTQIVHLWKTLHAADPSASHSLEKLLQGSQVYVPPPPPKPEPSEEYKALMTRLRREADERSYERMINQPTVPDDSLNRAFAEVNRPSNAADMGDDEVTLNEIHRQVMLIINFLVSICGVAATLWIAGRWWSLPSRLFLAMGGSLLVAIAEVAVYSGYMWRLDQAKQKQSAVKEVKHVVKTWVVGQDEGDAGQDETILVGDEQKEIGDGTMRKRNLATSKDSSDT